MPYRTLGSIPIEPAFVKKKREKKTKKEKAIKDGRRDGIIAAAKCEVSATTLIKTICIANISAIIAKNNLLEKSHVSCIKKRGQKFI